MFGRTGGLAVAVAVAGGTKMVSRLRTVAVIKYGAGGQKGGCAVLISALVRA